MGLLKSRHVTVPADQRLEDCASKPLANPGRSRVRAVPRIGRGGAGGLQRIAEMSAALRS
jgi:glycosyltransferase A (GT-A) superfamily protein (DUF2064 family)